MSKIPGYKESHRTSKYNVEDGRNTDARKSSDSSYYMFSLIRENIIGKDTQFQGAYGVRKVFYCDYTASGRSLKFIEDYMRDNVLPHYGSTHTETSVTSLQTTMFRKEARDIIRQAVNASENNAVIFTGTGCTGAVHKLIHAMNLEAPPIVFVSPYEHHSNLLPWKEIGSKIVWIRQTIDGNFDYEHLEAAFHSHQNLGRSLLGCFAAASNVTGILIDTDRIAHIVHKYNGLVFFDYATAGPYVEINMNPTVADDGLQNTYKDAVFISTHKFVGGPGCPGILISRKNLFVNPVPSNGGGGSVFFVTENHHRYLKEIEMREEGGTPDIIGSIRSGLVFQLKDNVGINRIHERDQNILRMANEKWSSVPNLIFLGRSSSVVKKLPIFSFLIKHPASGRFLHHNYVAVLLNDLFGIQTRGGCACSGPYAQKLLGMTLDISLQIEGLLLEDQRLDRHHLRRYREYSDTEILRPGFTRLNLPYFFADDEVTYVLKAVAIVAEHGWKLLPQYLFYPDADEWHHKDHKLFKDRKWLGSIRYSKDGMKISGESITEPATITMEGTIQEAERIILNVEKHSYKCGDQTLLFRGKGEALRWFLLPCEAQDYLEGVTPSSCKNFHMPFYPGKPVDSSSRNTDSSNNENTETLPSHYICTCTPYKKSLSQYRLRFNDNESNSYAEQNNSNSSKSEINGMKEKIIDGDKSMNGIHVVENVQQDISALEKQTVENRKVNGSIANDDNNSCILVCKPVAPRKLKVPNNITVKNVGVKFHNPPKTIFAPAVEGIEEFNMIKDGDRVLLCLSGGKDSLSMLHVVNQYKYYARAKGTNFEFGAMTVDPQSAGYDPSPLIGYLKALNVPYFYEEQDIIAAAANLTVCESICSFCSRMKRGRIYSCARREKYNVIVLGQHLDDIAESFLMSTFHNGYLRSMKANYTVKEGDLRVIRPLVFVREKVLRMFAEKNQLPVIPENCPACFEAPKERHRMKQLLAQQEVLFPNLFQSLRSALHPLISKDKTGLEKRNMDEEI